MINIENSIDNLRTFLESLSILAGYVAVDEETITVTLDADDIDWTQYSVEVFDRADNILKIYLLDSSGECTFTIPFGHLYLVNLPVLSGFIEPPHRYYSAVLKLRSIVYQYSESLQFERLRITVASELTGLSSDILDGETITVEASDGATYSEVILASSCVIEIPYGKIYTLTPPTVSGYRCSTETRTYEAGVNYRYATLLYDEELYGMFGVDDDGNMYTIDQILALSDKTIIKYAYYNDETLANSIRPDGGIGNGFYWKIASENIGSMQWCVQNIQFDVARLPFYSKLGTWTYAGAYMTDKIIEIGRELLPNNSNPTPAATACVSRSITIAGREHTGFLLSYDLIHKIATDNRTLFLALYSALGRVAPTIWSGSWWTSCLASATGAVYLDNGGYRNTNKTTSYSVMVGFDL